MYSSQQLYLLMMRYQDEEKGLFTFYREQHQLQQQDDAKKSKGVQTQERQRGAHSTLVRKIDFDNNKNAKGKVFKGPDITANNPFQRELKIQTKIKSYGDSLMIMQRKKTDEDKRVLEELKLKSVKQQAKQRGYYLQNRKMEFELLKQEKINTFSILGSRRKSYLKAREESKLQASKTEESGTVRIRFPALVKMDQQAVIAHQKSIKNRYVGILKPKAGQPIRQIKANSTDKQTTFFDSKRSVSYIEYNKDYFNEGESKKAQNLSAEQKRLLQLLSRYKKTDY